MTLIDKEALKAELRRHVLYANPPLWASAILQAVEPIITEAPRVSCDRCRCSGTCACLVSVDGPGTWHLISGCTSFESKDGGDS